MASLVSNMVTVVWFAVVASAPVCRVTTLEVAAAAAVAIARPVKPSPMLAPSTGVV